MKRLSLHIGSHKTGTTSVQFTFERNRERLLQRGLAWVQGETMPNLHQYLVFADPAQIVPKGYRAADAGRLAAVLAAAPADHVFASSENFSFFFTQDAIDELAAALRPHFDRITIIAYLRRQDRHAISHHQEGAKPERPAEGELWGHALTPLPRPAPQQRLYLDYDARIAMWEKAFGADNLRVRLFDRAILKQGDIVPDILDVLGVPDEGLERLPDVNVSLDPVRAGIGHMANAAVGSNAVTTALLSGVTPSAARMQPSADEARAFLAPYLEGNRRLNARLGITGFPDLFPDDFSDYPDTAPEIWTRDTIEQVLREVMSILALGLPMRHLGADDLRTAALALRATTPQIALRFIRAANDLRPTGPLIQKIRAELEREVKALAEREAATPR